MSSMIYDKLVVLTSHINTIGMRILDFLSLGLVSRGLISSRIYTQNFYLVSFRLIKNLKKWSRLVSRGEI